MDSVEPMQVDEPESGLAPPSDFTVDNPNFDLETYASSYAGFAKIKRLVFIARHCPTLRVDSLKYGILPFPRLSRPVKLPLLSHICSQN